MATSSVVRTKAHAEVKALVEAYLRELAEQMHMPWNPADGFDKKLDKLADALVEQAMRVVANEWSRELLSKLWSGKEVIQDVP